MNAATLVKHLLDSPQPIGGEQLSLDNEHSEGPRDSYSKLTQLLSRKGEEESIEDYLRNLDYDTGKAIIAEALGCLVSILQIPEIASITANDSQDAASNSVLSDLLKQRISSITDDRLFCGLQFGEEAKPHRIFLITSDSNAHIWPDRWDPVPFMLWTGREFNSRGGLIDSIAAGKFEQVVHRDGLAGTLEKAADILSPICRQDESEKLAMQALMCDRWQDILGHAKAVCEIFLSNLKCDDNLRAAISKIADIQFDRETILRTASPLLNLQAKVRGAESLFAKLENVLTDSYNTIVEMHRDGDSAEITKRSFASRDMHFLTNRASNLIDDLEQWIYNS
jgi:hypothetical protein